MFRPTIASTLRAGAMLIAMAMFSGNAWAQSEPSTGHIQVARDVVLASGASRAFRGVVPSILEQTLNIYVQQNPDLQRDLVESIKEIQPEFEKRLDDVVDIVAGVYATRFTEDELKEILTFYQSPAGKKMVAQLPGLLEESYVKTQEWGGRLSEEVVVRLRAEMKKKGHDI